MAKSNIHVETHELYKVESGTPPLNPELGECYYKLTCGDLNGFAFYKEGEHILHARKISIEKVGTKVEKSHNDSKTFLPTKIILAESGDIYFEAKGGDIIMKGNNIIMQANGSENDEGHIILKANNTIVAEGKNIDINAMSGSFKVDAKTGVAIRGGSTVISGSSVDIQEGLGITVDLVSSILTGNLFKPDKFLNIFKNFLVG
jgi:hypothetical protein